jgi:hypothetical protein
VNERSPADYDSKSLDDLKMKVDKISSFEIMPIISAEGKTAHAVDDNEPYPKTWDQCASGEAKRPLYWPHDKFPFGDALTFVDANTTVIFQVTVAATHQSTVSVFNRFFGKVRQQFNRDLIDAEKQLRG